MSAPRALALAVTLASCGARTGLNPLDAGPPPAPCVTDLDCDDGAWCTGAETCREGQCVPGAPVVCLTGGDVCVESVCDEEARACRRSFVTEDRDGDGHRAPRPGTRRGDPDRCGDDCDDDDPAVHPGATEVCNGVDDDCNEVIDDDAVLSPGGASVLVSDPAVAPSAPGGVAWTGARYAASFWGYEAGKARVFFAAIDREGRRREAQRAVTTTPSDAFGAAVAWTGRVLGAVWQDRRDPSGGYEIYFNRLTPDGERLGPDLRVTAAPGFSINPAIAWTGEEFILAWQDERDSIGSGGYEIYAQRIDEEGRLILPNQRITRDPSNSEAPSIAVGDRGLGLAWLDGRGGRTRGIWFAPFTRELSRQGPRPAGPPRELQRREAHLTWNRDRWVIAWYDDDETSAEPRGLGRHRATPQASRSGRRDGSPPTLAYSRYPQLLPLGDQVLMVWADDRVGAQYSSSRRPSTPTSTRAPPPPPSALAPGMRNAAVYPRPRPRGRRGRALPRPARRAHSDLVHPPGLRDLEVTSRGLDARGATASHPSR
ncbi:MAG: putative metal-binding motif-containing protein [Polyangiales bacterium]